MDPGWKGLCASLLFFLSILRFRLRPGAPAVPSQYEGGENRAYGHGEKRACNLVCAKPGKAEPAPQNGQQAHETEPLSPVAIAAFMFKSAPRLLYLEFLFLFGHGEDAIRGARQHAFISREFGGGRERPGIGRRPYDQTCFFLTGCIRAPGSPRTRRLLKTGRLISFFRRMRRMLPFLPGHGFPS